MEEMKCTTVIIQEAALTSASGEHLCYDSLILTFSYLFITDMDLWRWRL